ncbi:MAG: ester cyclase [Pseudomonadota bacterium]
MLDTRADIHAKLCHLAVCSAADLPAALTDLVAQNAVFHIADPIGDLTSTSAMLERWYGPLRRALPGAMRRDDMVIGGASVTGSGYWLATLGHHVGNFEAPLFGIAPHGKLVFLRCGEFYRVHEGRVIEARILPDVLDLLRQVGRLRLPQLLGSEGLFPAPATHDGVLPGAPERSTASLHLVEAMLRDLRHFDPTTFESARQTGDGGYWRHDMLWYGPSGIGANFTHPGFQRDHRVPFLQAFPDRVGGNHFARFGDGDYVASGGWPSMTMTHRAPYLGIAPTGRALTLRVMDFWRVAGSQIAENWVLLDLVDLFRQMGTDLLERAGTP